MENFGVARLDDHKPSLKRSHRIIGLLVLGYIGLSLVYVVAGRIHVDEGSYLYAANAVYRGAVPYRDFFFLQPPLYPYIYGIPQRLFGSGILIGRLTSLCFSLAILIAGIGAAKRLHGPYAAMIFLLFMVTNPTQIYFFTITRLFALTGFFFAISIYFLTDRRQTYGAHLMAMLFMGLAILTRLTVAPGLVVLTWYIWTRYRQQPARWILPAGLISGMVVAGYGFFYLQAPDRFLFNILGLNLTLHSHNTLMNLTAKARTSVHLLRHNFFLLFCLIAVAIPVLATIQTRFRRWCLQPSPTNALWALALLVSAGHFSAKIFQESYQSFVTPLLMLLTAIELATLLQTITDRIWRQRAAALFLIGCVLTLLSHGRENLQIVAGKTPLGLIAEQAEFIKAHSQPGDLLFSADSALLAVEAERNVLSGMAGSDYFPYWDSDKCRRFRVTNTDIVQEYLEQRAGKIVIIGDLSYTLTLPELEPVPEQTRAAIWRTLEANYDRVKEYPNLHVPNTNVYFYLPKTSRGGG